MRVVVLGGGFAGVYAARRLEHLARKGAPLDITLVSQENFFLFTPMLHEIAASDLMSRTSSALSERSCGARRSSWGASSRSIWKRRVLVSHGFDRHAHEIEYDHVIIALGSITNSITSRVSRRTH